MLVLKPSGLGSCELKAARQVGFIAGEALSTPGVAGKCPVASYLIKTASRMEQPELTKVGWHRGGTAFRPFTGGRLFDKEVVNYVYSM